MTPMDHRSGRVEPVGTCGNRSPEEAAAAAMAALAGPSGSSSSACGLCFNRLEVPQQEFLSSSVLCCKNSCVPSKPIKLSI